MSHQPKQKSLTRTVDGETYLRVLLRTHCIMAGENFPALARRYYSDALQPGDIAVVSHRAIRTAHGESAELSSLVLEMSKMLGVQVCVVSANVLGRIAILAQTSGVDTALIKQILLDNPLGE